MALTHTIFAVLNSGPQSGYDLCKTLNHDCSCFWQASPQQIYRELNKLEEAGLITPQIVEQIGKPNKKIYFMQPKAHEILQQWLAQPSRPTPIREDLMVKTLVSHLTDSQTMIKELRQQEFRHQRQLEQYQLHWKDEGCSTLLDLPIQTQCQCITLRRGIYHEQSWVDWCKETITWLNSPKKFKNL